MHQFSHDTITFDKGAEAELEAQFVIMTRNTRAYRMFHKPLEEKKMAHSKFRCRERKIGCVCDRGMIIMLVIKVVRSAHAQLTNPW